MKMNKKYIILFTAIILTICSCKNSFQTKPEIFPENQDMGIITVSASTNNARSISPSADNLSVANLTNIKLEGLWGDETTPRTVISEKATWSAFQAVSTTAVQTGSWVFTLTAQLNGMKFSATQGTSTNPVTITKNTTTNLTFELQSTANYGGLSIVINVTQGDASKVVATLKTRAGAQVDTQTLNLTSTGSGKTATYSVAITDSDSDGVPDGGIETGNYNLELAFNGVNLSTSELLPLNNWKGIVRINAGITTTSTIDWTTGDVYTLVFERNDGLFPVDVIPNTFTRKTTITLPEMTKTGYLFEGWYTDAGFSADKQIAEVSSSTMTPDVNGEMTVYARYIDTLYVDVNGNPYSLGTYEDGTRLSSAFSNIDGAISKIINTGKNTSSVDWKIMVNGQIQTVNTISDSLTSSLAKSITIQGASDNTTDILNGLNGGSSLTINTAVPVTIQNLRITGGNGTSGSTINASLDNSKKYGGGLLVKQGTVTLGDGALIQNNTADKGGGVCVVGDAVLKMTGSAGIPAGTSNTNDVYFTTQTNVIKIAGEITPSTTFCSDGVVAKYTLDSPAEDLTMLAETGSNNWVNAYFANFGIVAASSDASDAYFINPDGKTENGYIITKDNYSTALSGITSSLSTYQVKVLFAGGVGTSTSLMSYIKAKINNMPCLVKLDFSYAADLVSVPNQAFNSCTQLYSVKLPAGVTYIGTRAFSGCTQLVSIDIPSCDQELEFGTYVFHGDTALASFVIPKNTKALTLRFFYECPNLKTITFEEGFSLDNIGGGSEVPFAECGIESIVIPASVKTIGQKAFESCTSLKTVTFAEGSQIKNIDSQAFNGCDIRTLVFPAHTESISLETWAFESNANLSSVTFNGNMTFGNYVFDGCSSLQSIDLSDIPEIGQYAFKGAGIKTITFAPNTIIGDNAFQDCPISTLDLTNVKEIGKAGFKQTNQNNVTATSLTIPKSLEKIGAGAFSGWNQLTSVDFKHKLWKLSGGTEPFDLSAETVSQIIQYLLNGSYALSNASKGWEKFQYGDKDAPTAVYDIVFKDGTATAYTDGLTLDSIHQGAAIAVIFYIGTDCSNDDTERMLGLGFNQSSIKAFAGTGSSSADYSRIKCEPSSNTYPKTVSGSANDRDGRDNFSVLKEIMTSCTSFPAFEYADTYGTTILSLPDTSPYATGWYLPTTAEFAQIAPYSDSERTHMLKLQTIITACGGSLVLDTSSAGVFMTSSTAKTASGSTKCYAFFARSGASYYGTSTAVTFVDNQECAVAIRQFN